MEFETLKKSHLKRNIIIGVVVVAIISAIILNFTRAKYRTTQSIPLVNGTINYSASDLNVIAITIDGEKADTIPTGNYMLLDSSYCTIDGEEAEVEISWDAKTQTLTLIPFTTKGTKCYLDFQSTPSSNIQILATVNGSSSNTFPSKSSNYTPDSVTCTNGAEAKFDFVDWAVEVDTVESTTCTVNFVDNVNETFANYLIGKECSSTPTSDDVAKKCLVNENGYRYEGKNPNNYVLFNDELWRVIGVFNVDTESNGTQNLVKLIRSETLDGLVWDATDSNDWSSATLQLLLNNGYYNATDSTCNFYKSNTKTCYFSETGLNSTARNMVESVNWDLENRLSWTGKVALMSSNDYKYAVLANHCARTTNLVDYSSTACARNNWLKPALYEWIITSLSPLATFIYSHGNTGMQYQSIGFGVRPSIYLNADIVVLGGDGSRYFPYIIE